MAIPPELIGWVIPVAALMVGAAGWGLALYTRHVSRRDRAKPHAKRN